MMEIYRCGGPDGDWRAKAVMCMAYLDQIGQHPSCQTITVNSSGVWDTKKGLFRAVRVVRVAAVAKGNQRWCCGTWTAYKLYAPMLKSSRSW
jgi:hypothetical protein